MRRTLPLAFLLTLALTGSAHAGSYDVRACDDTVAAGANNSWTLLNDDPATLGASETCNAYAWPPRLRVFDRIPGPPDVPAGKSIRWRFAAPLGATITALNGDFSLSRQLADSYSPFLRTAEGTLLLACPGPGSCTAGHSVQEGPWSLSTSSLELGVRCDGATVCTTGYGQHRVEASASYVTVTLSESEAPSLTPPTGALWAGGYVPRSGSVTFGATDDVSGIRKARLYVDGALAATATQSCDFTLARPCADRPEMTLTPPALADGSHTVQVAAVDAARNETRGAARSITVDNAAPAAPHDLRVSGNDATYVVTWTNPGGQVAPLTDALVRVCDPTFACTTRTVPAAAQQATFTPAALGTYTVAVWLRDAAGNEDQANAAAVSFNRSAPPPTSAPTPGGSSTPPSAPGSRPAVPPMSDRVPAKLTIHQARRRGRRVTVTGTLRPATRGRLSVTYRAQLRGRMKTLRRSATVSGGRWQATLTLGPALAHARTGRVTVRFAGSSTTRAASASTTITPR